MYINTKYYVEQFTCKHSEAPKTLLLINSTQKKCLVSKRTKTLPEGSRKEKFPYVASSQYFGVFLGGEGEAGNFRHQKWFSDHLLKYEPKNLDISIVDFFSF